jgi:outer membrane usher protein
VSYKRYLVAILLLISAQLNALQSASASNSVLPENVSSPQKSFLTLEVNGTVIMGIFYAEKFSDGRIILVEDAWRAANLNISGEKQAMDHGQFGYDITSLQGMSYELDISSQSIVINAQSNAFGMTDLTKEVNIERSPLTSPLGAFVNYSLNSTMSNQGSRHYGSFVEAVAFNHYGSLVSSAVTSGNNGQFSTFRAETYFQKDLPAKMQRVIIGDSVTSAGAWSRPIRFGGIKWSTDFSLQRGYSSIAMPSIDGSAALPSTIDIFIDNQKRQSNSVTAGPFQISDFPLISNGVGQIDVVVTDILGVERISTEDFYSSARLLKKSVNEFSYEAGMQRQNYGIESNAYNKPFIAATYSRGFDGYTVEGRTELQGARQAAGIEVAGLIKHHAVMYFALAASKTKGKAALHSIVGIEHSSKKVNFSVRGEHYDRDFVPMGASIEDIGPRRRILLGMGLNVYKNLWLNANVLSQTSWSSYKFNLLSARLAIPLIENIRLNTYVTQQFGQEHSYTVGLNIAVPFGRTGSMGVSSSQDSQGEIVSNIEVNQTLVEGVGYRARANDSYGQSASASIWADTSVNRMNLDIEQSASGRSFRFRTRGSVGLLGGLAFASKYIGHGSFAVVKVADEPDIDIYRSNSKVARTNSRGLAMVTNMVPYQQNKISINAQDIPFDLQVNETSQLINPYALSGVFINLDIIRANNRLVTLLKADGTPIRIGSKVHVLPSKGDFIVGKRGQVYLMGLSSQNTLQVSFEEGACSANLSAPINRTDNNTVLTVECR